ncbi:MAG TPA: hypothetical protein VEU47_10480 [Candidatus Cybelea sp.]|nr:hypothetical protein [Candidatus Cybelea sp.]
MRSVFVIAAVMMLATGGALAQQKAMDQKTMDHSQMQMDHGKMSGGKMSGMKKSAKPMMKQEKAEAGTTACPGMKADSQEAADCLMQHELGDLTKK